MLCHFAPSRSKILKNVQVLFPSVKCVDILWLRTVSATKFYRLLDVRFSARFD